MAAQVEPNSTNGCHVNQDGDKLVFAQVLYRHGARNIDQPTYPNDPYGEERHWPEGFGQLTHEGKRQCYDLGRYFRRRYGQFLTGRHSWTRVHVQSTETDRTIMSAQANVAGMFPPTEEEMWHDEINWQPVPVRSIPMRQDYVLFVVVECPKYKHMLNHFKEHDPVVLGYLKKYAAKFTYWSEQIGKDIVTISDAFHLYCTLDIERRQNKTLPAWAEEEMNPNGPLTEIANYQLSMATGTRALARLKSGFFIKELMTRFQDKIDGKLRPDKDLWFYSVHDLTIASILNTFGMFEHHIPPFASSLHLELYQAQDGSHYIQFYYRKSNEEELTPMNIPKIGYKMTLERFYEVHRDIIPDKMDKECALDGLCLVEK